MERDKQADLLKGYACLLVIIGHVIVGIQNSGISTPAFFSVLEKGLWSFHIDLFMFLSGYVFAVTGGVLSRGSRPAFLLNKLVSLGIPYFAFSVLYIAVNSLTPGVNHTSSISDIARIWYQPTAQYWFIYALFWIFVLWTIFSKLLKNPAWITAVLYAVFILFKCFHLNLGFLDSSMNCVLAFGLGTCTKSLNLSKIPKLLRVATVILHTIVTVVLIRCNLYASLFVDDLLTVFGIFSSICLISLVARLSFAASALNSICRYSFPLYLLHTFFTAGARILLLKLGVVNLFLHLTAGIAAGIVFPIVIAKIAARTPYLNFFFYPVRAIAQIKSKRNA